MEGKGRTYLDKQVPQSIYAIKSLFFYDFVDFWIPIILAQEEVWTYVHGHVEHVEHMFMDELSCELWEIIS